jgi:hypothetical protein
VGDARKLAGERGGYGKSNGDFNSVTEAHDSFLSWLFSEGKMPSNARLRACRGGEWVPAHCLRKYLPSLRMPQNDLAYGESGPCFGGPWAQLSEVELVRDGLILVAGIGPSEDQLEGFKFLKVGREFSFHVQEAVRRIPFWLARVPFAQRVLDLRLLLKGNAGLGEFTSDSGSSDL